jgi:hypothetical protein
MLLVASDFFFYLGPLFVCRSQTQLSMSFLFITLDCYLNHF